MTKTKIKTKIKKPKNKKITKKKIIVKAKRGRPRKIQKTESKSSKKIIKPIKSSKIQKTESKSSKLSKKTIKPIKKHTSWLPDDYKEPKSFKMLGYCRCHNNTTICTKDLVSKFIYICPACNKRARINKLLTILPQMNKLTKITKKEWNVDMVVEPHNVVPLYTKIDEIKIIE